MKFFWLSVFAAAAAVASAEFATPMEALSPYGENFRQNLKCVYNGDRGPAMLTYTTLSGGLWAQYWDGESFTVPTNLLPAEGKKTTAIGDRVVIAWINTDGNESEEAQARNGDCIIFFTAVDADGDGPAPEDGENRALWSVYFHANDAGEPEANNGFQKLATRVSPKDRFDENVICHGVVTDGLEGEARWLNFQNRYRYGHETTGIVVFWSQAEDTDGDVAVEDLATWYAWYDLTAQVDAALPIPHAAPVRLTTPGGADSGALADQTRTEARYVSYNNTLILRAAADTLGSLRPDDTLWGYGEDMGNNDDIFLLGVTFNLATGTATPPTPLHASPIVAGDGLESNAMPLRQDGSFLSAGRSMVGPDEGCAHLMFIFAELVNSQASAGAFGDMTSNGRLAVVEINPATGAVLGHVHLDAEDADISDTVNSTQADFRLSRNGDYVWVAWIEAVDAGAVDEDGLWVRMIQTVRNDDEASSAPGLAARVAPLKNLNADADTQPVNWFVFEEGLGYVTGSQADALVMRLYYEQSNGTFDRILAAKLTADVVAPLAPTTSVATLEDFKEGDQPGLGSINGEHHNFVATDGGSGLLAFYVQDNAVSPVTDFRVYAERNYGTSTKTQIDSDEEGGYAPFQDLLVQGTPAGTSIAQVYDDKKDLDNRNHFYETVHVFFREHKAGTAPTAGFVLQTRQWHEGPGGPAFGNHFTPKTEPPFKLPFTIDPPGAVPLLEDDTEIWGIAVDGYQVGLWFTHGKKMLYTEFEHKGVGSKWYHSGADTSDPVLVDDADGLVYRLKRSYYAASYSKPGPSAPTVEEFRGFFTRSCTARTLQGAGIFWLREMDYTGYPRLLGRMRIAED